MTRQPGDAAGRTTSVVTSAGTTSLTYDYESRVSQITYPSSATNTFTYNGLDTRVSKVDSSGTSSYLRDGVSPTSPLLADGSSAYTPGISVKEGSQVRFQHSGLKNIDFQSRTNNNLGSNRIYDAFGALTADNGNAHIGGFGYGGGFGYQGDPDSGLMLLGHRYYDPSTGRFLTRDPIKDGRNWYGYCENNPLNGADPSGLVMRAIHAAIHSSILALLWWGQVLNGGIANFYNPLYPSAPKASPVQIQNPSPTSGKPTPSGSGSGDRGGKPLPGPTPRPTVPVEQPTSGPNPGSGNPPGQGNGSPSGPIPKRGTTPPTVPWYVPVLRGLDRILRFPLIYVDPCPNGIPRYPDAHKFVPGCGAPYIA